MQGKNWVYAATPQPRNQGQTTFFEANLLVCRLFLADYAKRTGMG